MMFKDRKDAALQLIDPLLKYKGMDGVVLAIPKGGVPIGYIIARELNMPLQVNLIKKIGHPHQPEFAIGAVSMEGVVIDENIPVYQEYIENESRRIQEHLKQQFEKYMMDKKPVDLDGKVVIIADDGIATGYTVLASIKMIRNKNPEKIVVAAPVAPPRSVRMLEEYADEVICLYTPEFFQAVGQFYQDFRDVSEEDVMDLLQNQ
jgi:putative phosphoribosyl transferase